MEDCLNGADGELLSVVSEPSAASHFSRQWLARRSPGPKGTLKLDADQDAKNRIFYAEDSFYVLRDFAVVGGIQHVHASREQTGFLAASTGTAALDFWSPKIGMLWDVTPKAQVFANADIDLANLRAWPSPAELSV